MDSREIKIIRVGQVSNQGSQSGMVYDTNGLFPTICAYTHGYAIGNIIEYLDKGEINMWKNELPQLDFLMEEVRVFDSFCGIGALHQALKELGVPVKLVGVSEIDVDAIVSYAAIHIENFKDIDFEYPSDNEMKQLLKSRNIGYDFKSKKSKIDRMKKEKLKLVYKATILLNNLGDISIIKAEDIPEFDIFNMSFPCQSFSLAGRRMGIDDFRGTLGFTSIEILNVKKPKYFLIENVPGLISIDDGNTLKNMLRLCCDAGYKIAVDTLNAKYFGVPQNRNRLFVLGVLKDGV